MNWSVHLGRLWLFVFISLAGLVGASYLILSRGIQSSITRELFEKQKLVAVADAANIEFFFEALGNSVALRAQLASMESPGPRISENMDAFVNQWRDSGLVSGIILTDKRGIVTFNSNVAGTHDIGESLADRDYFTWAKDQEAEGEYFIGQPVISKLGISEGSVIVPVASPVFRDDVFLGVLTAAVKLQPLAQRNLEIMKISDKTKVYLFDQNSSVLYNSSGSRVLSGSLVRSLNVSREGSIRAEGHLISYAPVSLGSQRWLVVVASLFEEIFDLAVPLYIRQVVVLLAMSLTTLAFGIYVSRQG